MDKFLLSLNPTCSNCKCYWKPSLNDIKSSGLPYKTCKKCREREKQYWKKKKEKENEELEKWYSTYLGGEAVKV
jgi:hypothetical protein